MKTAIQHLVAIHSHGDVRTNSAWEVERPNLNPDWKSIAIVSVLYVQDRSH